MLKPGLCLLLILFAAMLSGCASTGLKQAYQPEKFSRQILVNFSDTKPLNVWEAAGEYAYHGGNWNVSPAISKSIKALEKDYGIVQLDSWPINSLKLHCVLFAIPNDQDISEIIQSISKRPGISFVEEQVDFELMMVQPKSYSDPLLDVQYPNGADDLSALHMQSTGENIRIGIIDSAIDRNHPDLEGQIFQSESFLNKNEQSDFSHGTAIAGIIAARANNQEGIVGLAPNAKIYAYEACGYTQLSDNAGTQSKTKCSSFNLAKALEYALDDNLDVLNLSLSGRETPLIKALVEALLENATTLVAAKNPSSGEHSFPAALPGVIGIGSRDMERHSEQLWFCKDEHLSTQAGGGYRYFYGSSVATAGMSGYAAILRSTNSAEEVQTILKEMRE